MNLQLIVLLLDAVFTIGSCIELSDTHFMLNPSGHKRDKRAAVEDLYLWPNGVIPYDLHTYYTEKERATILSAMRHWEDHTCVRFVPMTDETLPYIFILPGVGCHSIVGRYRPRQIVSIGRDCFAFHTALHELGHVIGYYHEQSRPDRDEHVNVIYDKIIKTQWRQFDRIVNRPVQTGGVGYDYNSIMHYDRNFFSRDRISDTIVAKDPNIPVGGATELSEFDKVETNRLYHCDTITPGPKTVVPVPPPETFPPRRFACGDILQAASGAFSSPDHNDSIECDWMIKIPEGYYIDLHFEPQLSPGCATDFVDVYDTIDGTGYKPHHICDTWNYGYTARTAGNVGYVHYVSILGQGRFEASFTSMDINECTQNYCSHECENSPGGYECYCPFGYFLSADERNCFDVNECALNAAGCDHICVNTGGSYQCDCEDGFELQSDGKTCLPPGVVHPQVLPQPNPIVLPIVIAPEPDDQTITTQPPTTRPTTATTQPPTTRPTTATTQPPTQAGCGGRLTTVSGSLQSPNWPQTYPVDIECEWTIELLDPNSRISLSFNDQAFGLAGLMPACSKDTLIIYDGLGNTEIRTLCDTAIPSDIITTSNTARVKFIAGPAHGPARLGFRITYNTIALPTTPPPTTRPTTATTQPPTTRPTTATTQHPTARPTTATTQPPTQAGCGGRLTTASGSLQSPNWPETYNVDEECEWTIELPDTMSTIRITFDRREFGISGYTPDCLKDVLEIFDGLDSSADKFKDICGVILPDHITTSSNVARIVFTAGPAHGSGRKGFKIDYSAIAVPSPPTKCIPLLQTSPECMDVLSTEEDYVIKSPNWPETYPVNFNCEWLITVSDPSKVIEMRFDDHFGIAGSTSQNCQKDRLQIYDGHESNAASLGAYCEFAVPPTRQTSSNKAKITFTALSSHGPARVGFKMAYECVDA